MQAPLVELPHALMGGTRAMRAKGPKYLPQETNEVDSTYEARVKRTVLLNAYQRTIQKLTGEGPVTGMIFRQLGA